MIGLVLTLVVSWSIIISGIFPLLPENALGGGLGLVLIGIVTLIIVVGFTEHYEKKGD